MQELCLNEELTLSYPGGFHPMSEAERGSMKMLAEGPWIGLSDPRRQIVVTVGWKRVGRLVSGWIGSAELAKKIEKTVRSALQGVGYRCLGFGKRQIAGAAADGFRYEYSAQGVGMTAESYAVKLGRTIYYFHFYARSAKREKSLAIWEEILRSVRRRGDT